MPFKHLASGAEYASGRVHHHFEQVSNWPKSTTYYTGLRTTCAYLKNRCVDRICYREFEFEVGLTARAIRVELLRDIFSSFKIGVRIRFLGINCGQLVSNLLSNYKNNDLVVFLRVLLAPSIRLQIRILRTRFYLRIYFTNRRMLYAG